MFATKKWKILNKQYLWKFVILFLLWFTFMVPSFKNTASIFPEISFIQYFPHFSCKQWRHHWSNLHNRKTSISLKWKKIFQKEKHHSSVFWKGFQISTNYFSLHRHFSILQFPLNVYALYLEIGIKICFDIHFSGKQKLS